MQKITLQNKEKQPKPHSKESYVMKLNKAFNQTKLLDNSLSNDEGFVEDTEEERFLHSTTRLQNLAHSHRKTPEKDQMMTISISRKSVTAKKAGTSLITMIESAAEVTAGYRSSAGKNSLLNPVEKLPVSNYRKNSFSSVTEWTRQQTFNSLQGENPTEMASAQDGGSPLAEKAIPATVGRLDLSNVSGDAICKPKTHIVFLKVHKSASSTVMNILFRFGDTHNLTFAFPSNGGHQLYYPDYFTSAIVEGYSPNKDSQFNIMCHHMRFFQPEVRKRTHGCSATKALSPRKNSCL